MEQVILVNELDNPVGVCEKLEAHREGKLHRAFSIFIFNTKGELLLQQRALNKYHSGGLWTNTCCSHPKPGETTQEAANRRLVEEMGITSELKHLFSFTYLAKFPNNLIEHEFDHVFIGKYEGSPIANPAEVADWKWVNLADLKEDMLDNPQAYTEWLKLAYDRLHLHLNLLPKENA